MAATRPNLRGHLVLSALSGAIVNALFHVGLGWLIVRGFRLDWMVFDPRPVLEESFVLEDALFTGLGVGAIGGAISVLLAYRAFDRGHLHVPADLPFDGAERSRDAHAVLTALILGVVLGAFLLVNVVVLFATSRIDSMNADMWLVLKALMGGLAGGVAGWVATYRTAAGLAAGRIKRVEGHNLIASTALASTRHPTRVISVVLVLTLISSIGITMIDTNVDVADVLPRGNHNTEAAQNLTAKFKSSFTQQVTLQFRVNEQQFAADNVKFLPNRRTAAAPGNITDELYMRAVEQAVEFFVSQPPFKHSVAGPDFYRLVNWTIAGGQSAPDSAFNLPGTDPAGSAQYATVEQGVRRTIVFASLDALSSPDWKQTSALILVSPHEPTASRVIGERALEVRDAYVAWAEANPDEAFQVFTGENAPIFIVDLPIANARSSELTREDFKLLLPFIAYFIVLTLFLAFRHPSYILVAFSSLAVSTLWTFGAMGFLGIKLNTLNMTVVPLIMGVGIDYGIHMMNEFQSNRAKGLSAEEAFRRAGGHGAFALFIATVTTSIGLAVMVISPSLLIAQLGILSIIAIVACFLLAVSFIPAGLALYQPAPRSARAYREARVVPTIARHVGKNRVVYAVVLVVLALGASVSAATITNEPFGDPARNYLPDDPIRREHEQGLRGFYSLPDPDVKANVLVFEGNITDPAAHRYMDAIEASLKTKERVIADTLRTLPFLMRTWLTVKGGGPGVGLFLGQSALYDRVDDPRANPYPQTREEIEDEMQQVYESPLRGFGSLFSDYPQNEMAIMVFSVRAATYRDAEEVWGQVWDAVNENAALKPDGLQVSFAGNTATNYLFVAEEVPWLTYMSVAVNVAVFVLVLASTRNFKLAALVGVANFLTSLFWLGLLPLFGIGMAITLALPLVFIFAMGSDYVLHLGLACRRAIQHGGAVAEAYGTYGKGVFYSFLTTLGSFLIFTQISNVAVRKTMIATAIAIIMIFVTTMLLVPLFYPPEAKQKGEPGAPAPRAAPAAKPVPRVSVVEAPARGGGSE